MKRASWLRTLWIMLCSGLWTGGMAILVTSKMLLFGGDRAYFDRQTRVWSRHLLKMIRLSYQVHNPYQVDFSQYQQRRYIIMSNHLSLYDIPLLFLAIPGSLRMLAKVELRGIPLFGKVMEVGDFVFIDRHNREQALKDLELAKESMRSGILPWIAPEGTRSRDGKLLPFKKGGFMLAMEMQATIIPVGIRGIGDVLPADKLTVQLGGHVDIYIGKPIDTTHYSFKQREQLMADVRAAVIQAAGLS